MFVEPIAWLVVFIGFKKPDESHAVIASLMVSSTRLIIFYSGKTGNTGL